MTVLNLFVVSFLVLFAACSTRTNKQDFVHNYEKYWDKYTDQQLRDTLLSDTLPVGNDNEGEGTSRVFYISRINDLLDDLKDDQHSTDSLYPMTSFDELTIKKVPFGFSKTLTREQTSRLLEIINNPVSFNWSETTFEPKFQLDFRKEGKVVASLTIDSDQSIVMTEPNWPHFKKMKFGCLKPEAKQTLAELWNEIRM